jgi:CHAT domain-containing protein
VSSGIEEWANLSWSELVENKRRRELFMAALEADESDLDRAELLVLSACGTGLGQSRVNEGIFGLQRAFTQAGAKTAVASLWNMPDDATRLLMTRFHENLWGCERVGKKVVPRPRTMAIREAQIWMLREGAKHPHLLRGGLVRIPLVERPRPFKS